MKVLVTGGSGFLGSRLLHRLRSPSALGPPPACLVFDLRPPTLDDVVFVQGDVTDRDALHRVMEGVDVVFHMAALVDWGREARARLNAVNVEGTRWVLEAARAAGVRAVVHTSSIDVVFTGRPIIDGDESLPYADVPPNGYCATKAAGERVALAADDPASMRVAVIRPASIYGPADPYHIQALIDLAAQGRLFRVGNGRARSQMVYVDNVVHGHILAAAALLKPQAVAGGQAYFITDAPPANFFDFFAPVLQAAGFAMPPASRGLPVVPLFALGAGFEALAWAVRPVWRFAPSLTRFSVRFVALDFTVGRDKAEKDLGYTPQVDDDEAMRRTCAHYAPPTD